MRRRRPSPADLLRPALAAVLGATFLLVGWLAAPPAAAAAAGVAADGRPAPVVAAGPHIPTGEELDALPEAWQVLMIMGGTFISEEATCITVGMLMREGHLSLWVGGLACFLGIYVGDLTLFFVGRLFGKRLLRFRVFSHGFGAAKLEEFGKWFEKRPWAALAMCRVAPGLRLPLFLAVGALTRKTGVFFWWTCFFAFVWTPLLIGLVYWLGPVIVRPFEKFFGGGWKPIVLAVVTVFLLIRVVTLLATREGRLKIIARWDKLIGKAPAEEPLTDPASHKHVPGVEPVIKPSVLPETGK